MTGMAVKIQIDATDLQKTVSKLAKDAKLKKGEVRKITNFWTKAAYENLMGSVQSATKLKKNQVRKRMWRFPKRAKDISRKYLFYGGIVTRDPAATVHLGSFKFRKPRNSKSPIRIKGKTYPGAYTLPGYGKTRVYHDKQGGRGKSLNLPININDIFRKKGDRLTRLYGGKMQRDITKLAEKRMRRS